VSGSAIRAGAAYIELTLRDRVSRPLYAASIALKDFGNAVSWQGAKIAAMGAAITAPLAAMAHSFAESAMEAGKVGNRQDAAAVVNYVSALQRLSASFDELRIAIGSAVLPLMAEWPNTLARIISSATVWIRQNRGLVQSIARFGSVMVAAGTVIVVVGRGLSALGGVFGALATVTSAVASAVAVLGSMLAAMLTPLGLVMVGAAAFGAYIAVSSGLAEKALGWLQEKFAELKADAIQAWQGIGDALATGDIAAAARILWLALQMEWQKGVHAVTKVWNGVKTSMLQTWNDVVFGIARAWNDVWATVESGLVDAVAFMSGVLDAFYLRFRKGWGSATDEIAKGLLYLQGLVDPTLNVAQAQQNVDEDRQRINQGLDRNMQQRADEREKGRQERQAQIENTRATANDGLAQAQVERETQMQAAFDRQLAATQSKYDAARNEFNAARGAASEKRKAMEARDAGGPIELPDLAGPMATEKSKMESKGSFNALAARGLGANSLADRTAKATEQSAGFLKNINEQVKKAGMVFA
jgi:hypothetical protein